jgi:hypothetical protein
MQSSEPADPRLQRLQSLPDTPPRTDAAQGGDDPRLQRLQQLPGDTKPQKTEGAPQDRQTFPERLWEGIKAFGTGAARGGRDVLEAGAQIGARMGSEFPGDVKPGELTPRVDQAVRQSGAAYQQNPLVQNNPMTAGAGRIGGNIAATSPLMLMPGGAAASGLRSGAGLIGRGAASGALGGAAQPVTGDDFWNEKFKQVASGAAVGGALPAVGGALSPHLPSPDRITQGVSRAFRPIANFFTGAEERTKEGFARTFGRQVLEPIGGEVNGRLSGWELNRAVEDQIDAAYDRVLPNISVSYQGLTTSSRGLDAAKAALSTDEMKNYQQIIDHAIPKDFATRGAPLSGQEFREARTMIARQGYKWLGTNKEDIGEALVRTAEHMTDVVGQENPVYAAPLKAAGESYKLWLRMAAAASSGATAGGKFGPAEALRVIRTQDPTQSAFATGRSVLQGFSQAAHQALGGDRSYRIQDLFHLFARHGLPAQLYLALVGPAARAAKTASPYAAPALGATGASREIGRRATGEDAPEREPFVSTVGP